MYLALAVAAAMVAGSWASAAVLAGVLVTAVSVKAGVVVGAHKTPKVIVGLGPRLADWQRLVVRAFPVCITVDAGPGRRPRVVGAVFGAACAVALLLFVGWPCALGGAAVLAGTVIPMVRCARKAEVPGVVEVVELVQAGRLDEAERLVGRLTAEHPRQRTVRASRVLVLEARGRYSEALTLAIGMSDDDAGRQDAAASMAAVAGLTGAAVEAGQLSASAGLPVAARALNEAIQLGKPSHMMDGVRALLALLAGDPQLAVHLARLASKNNDDSLTRADDLATLARAYMAAGDNSSARRALAKAERLVPWWPRVALTRRRLDLA
ncbi:hypothetical protein [Actinocrispum sp. NPDC049592]|uniref:tetratricopeptide repeat protein n=1 Tax=Actinocrispum sp. NPDC049592 TaxID=3154835 RepID=UPI003428314D